MPPGARNPRGAIAAITNRVGTKFPGNKLMAVKKNENRSISAQVMMNNLFCFVREINTEDAAIVHSFV